MHVVAYHACIYEINQLYNCAMKHKHSGEWCMWVGLLWSENGGRLRGGGMKPCCPRPRLEPNPYICHSPRVSQCSTTLIPKLGLCDIR